jgi:uncharacterized protein YacL
MGRTTRLTDAPAEITNDSVGSHQPDAGIFEELSNTFNSARVALSNLLELLSLEARRAGIALMWMAAWGVIAGICIVSAWLGLMAALAIWAVSLGLSPIAAIIVVVVINLLLAAVLLYMCINRSRDLLFAATRRQMAGAAPVSPPV